MSEAVLDDILVPEQAAEKLQMSVKKLLRLAKRGEIPAKKVGRGEWRFKRILSMKELKGRYPAPQLIVRNLF